MPKPTTDQTGNDGSSGFVGIERSNLGRLAAEQVLQMIADGALKVGDRLPPERVLAAQLRISRPSLREAIAALDMLGVVEARSGSGTFIRSDSGVHDKILEGMEVLLAKEAPFQVMEARRLLEPEVAALAAVRRTQEDIERLRKSVDELGNAIETNADVTRPIMDFHLALAAAARNDVLAWQTELLARLWFNDATPWAGIKLHGLRSIETRREIHAAYTRITNAVASGNLRGARREMANNFNAITSNPFKREMHSRKRIDNEESPG